MPRAAPTPTPVDLPAPEDRRPSNSPRDRWRRFGWTVLGVALLVGITPAYWWLSGVAAGRALRQAIDARRQRGEPVLASDFPPRNLPADQNAATYLRRAAAASRIHVRVATRTGGSLGGPPPWSAEDMELVRTTIGINSRVLADVRRARQCAGADWGVSGTPQAWTGQAWNASGAPRSYLNDMLQLEQFLSLVAVYQHQTGDDAGALETTRDLLALSRAIDGQNGLLSHLSAFRGISAAASASMEIAPRLSIAGRPASGSASTQPSEPPKPADEAQVRALIAELLDDTARRAAITAAWQSERAARLAEFRQLADQGLRVRAVYDRAAVYELDLYDATLPAALAPDWPTADAAMGKAPPPPQRGPERKLAESASTVAGRVLETEFMMLTERRAAALALAIRLYELDHGGQRPAALTELVPAYLAAVPADPFAAGGQPFRYTQHAVDRDGITPAVYSVANDGKDDGGDGMTVRAGASPRGAGMRWFTKDAVFRLDPVPAPPPGS